MTIVNGKRKTDNGKWRPSWLVTALSVVTFPLSIIHYPLHAQQLQDSEIPTPLSERTLSTRFENLGVGEGLTQSTIFDITQDRHGYMWFSTYAGINRFDGHEVKQYTHVPFDSTSLGAGYNQGLHEDRDGNLWVAQIGGLSMLDPVTDQFRRYRFDPDDPETLSEFAARYVFEDRDGRIWVGTDNGLNRMDEERVGRFEHFLHDPDDETSLSHGRVERIYEDSDGYLWISTRRGLNRIDPRNTEAGFTRYLEDERALDGLMERPEVPGVLWVGAFSGLIRLDVDTGEFDRYTPPGAEGLATWVLGISGDPTNRNVLWVNFRRGVGRFDIRARQFITYGSDPSNPNNLSGDRLRTIFTDRSGIVWVGTEDTGVDRFNPATVGLAHYKVDPENPVSLPGPRVYRILKDRSGLLWVGTASATGTRLSMIDRVNGTAVHYERGDHSFTGRGWAGVPAPIQDRQGTIWITAPGGGVGTVDPSSGKLVPRFVHDPEDSTSISSNDVMDMLQDQAGQYWFPTMGEGLNRLIPGTDSFERYSFTEWDESGDHMFILIEDGDGYIWLGTYGGMYRLVPETGAVTAFVHDEASETSIASNIVYALHEREIEPGVIWAGTDMGGLNRLDTQTGEFRHYLKRDGLPDNVIYMILEDERGRLWMSTNNGLSRFDPETETFRNYGLEIGLQALEFNGHAAFRADDGEMFFGGQNGLNSFYPNELAENNEPPEVLIVDLKLSNQSVRESGALQLETALEDVSEIRLSPDQKDLEIDFVAVHYQNPELNQFAYKLDGFNEDWVDAGKRRSATYTNLDPGTYTFRVRAANSDGIWNEEGTTLTIIVEPPFWATWWFRLLALLGVTSVIFGAYRIRTNQLAARARHLEETVEHRTSALQESNEQLEQSHTIVEAINQETSFTRLLTKILEEARVIPGVEKATAFVYSHDEDRFYVRASSGWDAEAMKNIRLTPREARDRYVRQAEEVADDIFVAKDVAEREGAEMMAEFGQVASFLVLRIEVEGNTAGYLVFDNVTNPDAFDQRDVELLTRLREHIQSAFIKTRILEDLQTTLNDLQSTQDRLVQTEKMASLGQLTAGIAHEIRNPLNFVNNFSDVTKELAVDMAEEVMKRRDELPADLADELDSVFENFKVNAEKIHEHGQRAEGIVHNMLEHSKTGEGKRTPTDLNEFVDEYVTLARHSLSASEGDFEVRLERDYDDSVGKVELVPQEMGRVFMNLITNAFDALREHGANGQDPKVTVSTAKEGSSIEIRVSDNGPGIPEKVREKIFEPFYTTKPTGSGTGLGLSMSYDIVTKGHGGELDVVSAPGEGATFVVRLPA